MRSSRELVRSQSQRLTSQQPAGSGNRTRIFVDYWNLQLTMNGRLGRTFRFDWARLPFWLTERTAEICKLADCTYDGMHVCSSFNPSSEKDQSHKRWALNWLDRQPGVQVSLRERQHRPPPSCPNCFSVVARCPTCDGDMAGTAGKGVDTAIATDMIRLAWEHVYDIAVLVSSDADLVPAVEFLDLRGRKVLQAGFPPSGSALATACWASFDLIERNSEFERP